MDDIKRTVRDVEDDVRERLRDADGHDIGDDVGNAGDDLRRQAGNLGDDLRHDPTDPARPIDARRYNEADEDELEREGTRPGAVGSH